MGQAPVQQQVPNLQQGGMMQPGQGQYGYQGGPQNMGGQYQGGYQNQGAHPQQGYPNQRQ